MRAGRFTGRKQETLHSCALPGGFKHGVLIRQALQEPAVLIGANGQQGDDDEDDGPVAAVAIAVLDDVGQAGEGDEHGYAHDGGGDDTPADVGVLHELQVAGIFKPVDEAEDHDHAGGDHAQEQHQAVQDHQPVHIQAHEDRQGGQGGAAGDGGEVAAPGGEHQHGQAQAQDIEEKHAAHAPGAVLLGLQHGAAGENAGDGDPLESGIVDTVEEGFGYVGEAVGLEAGLHGVEEVHAPHEAVEVDDQRQGQDGKTHVAGAHPDQVCPEDGQKQDHNAYNQSAQVVVDAQILLQGAGGTGDAGGNHHEDHDVVEDIEGQV